MQNIFLIDRSKYRPTGLKCKIKNIFDIKLFPAIEVVSDYIYQNYDHDQIPNLITLTGLVLRIIGLAFLYYDNRPDFLLTSKRQKHLITSLCFLLSYLLDCTDGFYARKYNKCTTFGCYFDHSSDVLSHLFLLFLLVKKKMYFSAIILVATFFFALNQFMYEEEKFNNRTPFFECMYYMFNSFIIPNGKILKYWGLTTWILILSVAIFLE